MVAKTSNRWGDLLEEEEELPQPTTSGPDARGVITKVCRQHRLERECGQELLSWALRAPSHMPAEPPHVTLRRRWNMCATTRGRSSSAPPRRG